MIHEFNDRGRNGTILVATLLGVWSAAALTGCDDGGDPRFKAETYDEYTEPLTNAVIGTPGGTMMTDAAGAASDGGVVISPTPDAGPVRDAGGSVDGRPSGVGGATGAAGRAGGVDAGGFAGARSDGGMSGTGGRGSVDGGGFAGGGAAEPGGTALWHFDDCSPARTSWSTRRAAARTRSTR